MAEENSISRKSTDVVLERIGAQFVDNIVASFLAVIVFVIFLLIGSAFEPVSDSLAGAMALIGIVGGLATLFFYEPIFEYYRNGQTIGKKLTNIRVVKMDGSNIGGREAIIRNIPVIAFIVPYVGFLIYPVALAAMASNDKRQRLFDRLAETAVVKDSS